MAFTEKEKNLEALFEPKIPDHTSIKNPSEENCTELMQSVPQILFANLAAASAILNYRANPSAKRLCTSLFYQLSRHDNPKLEILLLNESKNDNLCLIKKNAMVHIGSQNMALKRKEAP